MSNQDLESQHIAVFFDMDNVVIGVRDARYDRFDVDLVLARLVEKGDLVVKRAYADWSKHQPYKRSMHDAAIEPLLARMALSDPQNAKERLYRRLLAAELRKTL